MRHKKHWTNIDALIIDEISMMKGETFDVLEKIARKIRKNDMPFGGLQLIVAGDFFQLPPVTKRNVQISDYSFAFECSAWKRSIDVCIEMSSVFRQKDPAFLEMLNKIRVGKVDQSVRDLLNQSKQNDISKKEHEDGIMATLIYAKNAHVDRINETNLTKLPGEAVQFSSIDKSVQAIPYQNIVVLLNGCLAPRQLNLKLGAQVMLLKNLSSTLINGSRGIVTEFVNEETDSAGKWPVRPKVLFSNGETKIISPQNFRVETPGNVITRTQFPLKLAYALTIHKRFKSFYFSGD